MEHNNFSLNRGIIATLCKEISADITEIRNNFPKTPERLDASIAQRFETLSRIADAVRLRSIHHATVVLARVSAVFVSTAPDQEKFDILQRCLRSLQNHLQEIIYEHLNTPVSMSRSLFNAMKSINMEISPVLSGEIFMPYMPEVDNKIRPTQVDNETFVAAVQEHRQAYNAALLKMVKTGDLTCLNQMRQALITLEPKNPYVDYRLFFDAAIAFFDRLIKQQQMDGTDKYLVGKIDPELNRILRGDVTPSDNVVSALLYMVAQSDQHTSVRIRKLQEHHFLQYYLADPNGVDPVVVEKFLNVLTKARETWTHAVSSGSLREFKKLIQEMHQKSSYLRNAGFTLIVDAMNQLTDFEIQNPESINKQTLSLEGASALLIMEQQLREGSYMDLARATASRIMALFGKNLADEDQYKSEYNESTHGSGRQRYSVLYRLAEEIQADLGGIEQNLLDFLSGNNDVYDEMMTAMKRVENVLCTLNSEDPALLVAEFTKNIRVPETAEERTRLASGFAHLTGMVELLKNSETAAIDAAKNGLDLLRHKEKEVVSEAVVEEAVKSNLDTPNDSDLLEIFLEESDEIIAGLRSDIVELKKYSDDQELLTRVRRAYHTLKGSGRMVGLKHFGEAAWLVEQTLNRWLGAKKGMDGDLAAFVTMATESVSEWINLFKHNGSAIIDYAEIESKATELANKIAPAQTKAEQAVIEIPAQIEMLVAEAVTEIPMIEVSHVVAAEPIQVIEPEKVVLPEPVKPVETKTQLQLMKEKLSALMGMDAVDDDGIVSDGCYETKDDAEWQCVLEYVTEWNSTHKDNMQSVKRKPIVEVSPWVDAHEANEEIEDTSWAFSETAPAPVKVVHEESVTPRPVMEMTLQPVETKVEPAPAIKVVEVPVHKEVEVVHQAQKITPPPAKPAPKQQVAAKPAPAAKTAQASKLAKAKAPVPQPQSFFKKILSWLGRLLSRK
jgi:chemosensory pili system protein ChpA (sensor histidine kinase/response regulator)